MLIIKCKPNCVAFSVITIRLTGLSQVSRCARASHNMYEGACVAGNKVEAAFALQSQSNIMGAQLSGGSSHHSKSNSSNSSSGPNKVYPRHSINGASPARKDEHTYRDQMHKIRASIRTKDPSMRIAGSDRPVTISEMNAYNVEKSSEPIKKIHNKEFYTGAEGYHKTEHCYYKTPDGGFHKLPPDSFNKMSEICYTKLADGSFRRLDTMNGGATLPSATSKQTDEHDPASGSHHRVRNQMIRFLKRSKSHTPATIKELQRAKEKERERLQAAAAMERHQNGGNRKVVVTMMESGGLPVVATSKPTPRRVETMRETKSSGGKDHHGRSNSTAKVCAKHF